MKKSTSFHLETDIIDYIVSYQNENNLSSRNIALERIIFEWLNMKKEIEYKDNFIEFANKFVVTDLKKTNTISKSNNNVKRSITDSYNSMPD